MRTFNGYKNYIDYFILDNFNYIYDLDMIRENAYVCFLHFLKNYEKLDDSAFLDKLNTEFYDYVFKYSVRNIYLFNDYHDREKLSLRVFLYYYNKYKKYPNITDIYMIYGVSKTNAHNISVYASKLIDINIIPKETYQSINCSDIEKIEDRDFYNYILSSIINDSSFSKEEVKIILLKNGYYGKKYCLGAIAQLLGQDKETTENIYNEAEKKLLKKYNKEYYL